MNKLVSVLAGAILLSVLFCGSVMAGNGSPSGPHWNINLIGHPKNVDVLSNDNSNGRAIMVPLKNANNGVGPSITCEADQATFTDDDTATFTDVEPTGAKIHFEAGDHFEIIDRDATDNDGATVMIPTDLCEDVLNDPDSYDPHTVALCENGESIGSGSPDRVLGVDVYVRVLGKPSTCMDIDGYAYDNTQGLWFWSGRIDLNRQHKQSAFIKVNEMFDVYWCQQDINDVDQDTITDECIEGTEVELSVFDNVFDDYFWNILNDGTRLVQIRLYPVTKVTWE